VTIWLIVEAHTDYEVMRAIFKAKGITTPLRYKMPNKQGGISRLAKELETIIEAILPTIAKGDCIAVLHDADEFSQPDRTHYEHIAQICEQYKKYVTRVIARDEIESWLLADGKLWAWLGGKGKPKNWDETKQPSNELESLLGKRNMKWQGKYRQQVLDHLDGTGDQHSPSMQAAAQHLARCS
jgi:hypothetical protein